MSPIADRPMAPSVSTPRAASPRWGRRGWLALAALGAFTSMAGLGCEDTAKLSEQAGRDALPVLEPLVERDVAQVQKGLPKGVEILAKRLAEDPAADRLQVQQSIKAARENVEELNFAKGTFFAFASPGGVVLRSEADPDRLVDQNLFDAFPGLKKVVEPGAGVVEVWGELEGMRGVRNGPDLAWVAAHAVAGVPGSATEKEPRGVFLTGWSFRAYAGYLQSAARQHFEQKARDAGGGKTPLVYVFLARGDQAYGDAVSPDVTAEQVAKLGLYEKAGDGVYATQITVEKTPFAVVAKRMPKLGPEVAIAVLASVL